MIHFLSSLFGVASQSRASRQQRICRLSIDELEPRSLPSATPLPVIPPAVQTALQSLKKAIDQYDHQVSQMVTTIKHDIVTKGDVKGDLQKLQTLTTTLESQIDATRKSILSNKNVPFRAKVGIWVVDQAADRLEGQITHLKNAILWDLQPAHHFTGAATQDATAIGKAADRFESQVDRVYDGVIRLADND
jgi:hypothetical protein